ncbi:MAG: hypothetical protein ACTSYI_16860 [Promethearchaeota archaeon]
MPAITKAVKSILKTGYLPRLKSVENAGIPDTLDYLYSIVSTAKENKGAI